MNGHVAFIRDLTDGEKLSPICEWSMIRISDIKLAKIYHSSFGLRIGVVVASTPKDIVMLSPDKIHLDEFIKDGKNIWKRWYHWIMDGIPLEYEFKPEAVPVVGE